MVVRMSASAERGRVPSKDVDDPDYGWEPDDPADEYPDEDEPW